MSEQMAASPFAVARPLAMILTALGMGSVFAQSASSGPYYIGASQGLTHQSNLFGASKSSGRRVSDNYASTGIFGGVNLELGRQNVYANGVARANRYNDVKLLDNNSSGLNAGLNWETVGNLNGTVRAAANRSLASYTTPGAPDLTNARNIETSHELSATVSKGITSKLSVTGGLQRRKVGFSAESYAAAEFAEREARVGIRYGRSDQVQLGLGYRKTKTDRDRARLTGGTYEADQADRDDVDLTASWASSGLSTVNARLSYGREDHSLPAFSGFKGTTGELGWTYRPTGRTTLNTSFTRDTGTSSSFLDYEGLGQPLEVYNSRLTNVVQGNIAYAATAKINLTGSLRYSKGKVSNATVATTGDDKVQAARLGATYAFSRAISFTCSAAYENRDTGTDDIATRTVACSGGLTFR